MKNDIPILERVTLLYVYEEEEQHYDMIHDAYLIKPYYAVYKLDHSIYLGKVLQIYQTGLKKFYVVDTDTSRITLAQNETRAAELVIPQIVAKLMGREVLDWLTLDVMHHMNNVYDFQVISPPDDM